MAESRLSCGVRPSAQEGAIKLAYQVEGPQKVGKLATKRVVAAACGPQHCAALDEEGRCYTWGCGGSWFISGANNV